MTTAASPINFAALLVGIYEVDRISEEEDRGRSEEGGDVECRGDSGGAGGNDRNGRDCAVGRRCCDNEDKALFDNFGKELRGVMRVWFCDKNSILTKDDDLLLDDEEDRERRELCSVIIQTHQNAEGKMCRCWVEPETWYALSLHKFIDTVVKPVVVSVCFEPRTCGYAKLVHPLVPADWITSFFAKVPYLYSLMYAAYRYKAHDLLFNAIGSQTISVAYNRLITKRRRRSHKTSINKRDTPVKQGEIMCKHIEPLVKKINIDITNDGANGGDDDVVVQVKPIGAAYDPPKDFENVVMASTAVQNEVYSLPAQTKVKRTVRFKEPCYIAKVCDDICSNVCK